MLIGQILRIWEWSGARRLFAVVVSAVVAFLVTIATTPLAQVPMAAGMTQIGLMQEEHSVIADYLRNAAKADQAAVLAEARERDDSRTISALAGGATAIPLPKPAKPVRIAASAKTEAAAAEPSSPPVVVTAPLRLQSTNSPSRSAPVQRGGRGVLATVERVPRWAWAAVQSAADWAIVGPAQTIARLPERRFL